MNITVKLQEWNGEEYTDFPCASLSVALACIERDNSMRILVTDEDSTAELEIEQSGASPEITSWLP